MLALLRDSEHPWLGVSTDDLGPILNSGNEPTVFSDMTFNDHLRWHHLSIRVTDGVPEALDTPLNTSSMVTERSVRPVTCVLLGFIQPIVDLNVVLGVSSPLVYGRFRVLPRSHSSSPTMLSPTFGWSISCLA